MSAGRERGRVPPVPRPSYGIRGFTLVELLAALLILDVGLLGVAGLAVTLGRTLSEAALRERAVAAVSSVADSLALAGGGGAGEIPFAGGGRVVWVPEGRPAEGLVRLRIEAEGPGRLPLLEVRAVVGVGAGEAGRASAGPGGGWSPMDGRGP